MLRLLINDVMKRRRTRPRGDAQPQARVAVALQTVLRPALERAIRSVFAQDLPDRIHLLIGVDKRLGNIGQIERYIASAPPNVAITVFDPGYSTSMRHGGPHSNFFGGSLRTVLSFAANSRYVAYLDDDDWFAEDHLSSLLAAVQGKAWAFSQRWFVNPHNLESMCVDTIENLGPDAGIYAQYGGFACPSSLLVDKFACAAILHLWSEAGTPTGDGEDRVFFKALRDNFKLFGTNARATAHCVIKPEDSMHQLRTKVVLEAGYPLERLLEAHGHDIGRV